MKRTMSGDVLFHRLRRDELTLDTTLLAERGRTARTLVKEGPLRLTLIALGREGDMPEHRADGPVSIHVIEGEVVFHAVDADHALSKGDVLVVAAGVPHSATSAPGCVVLLTVVHGPT